ncbi:M23 family metallopeptidase [Leptospira bandrabouensis]|uniref:M23 family metallopeptidase n=1 Tax=Leptospira bandrabouensis TaxID=2484903 RepID=UPI00223DA015|nr:M23 family metallopeptidase [Leptospira bandrabouensis]MCW7458234.1 M23 family metallopeptidase [Leptospira bandrabouensis]MCW7476896.1 M23 family metallopeptidase [Leptospira bandrabouensis]MCW7484578.1 M23 family metallopeptidase [Leptospira bandrabouensis]
MNQFLLIILFFGFSFGLYAESKVTEECNQEWICLIQSKDEDGIELSIRNYNSNAKITNSVLLNATLVNFKTDIVFPYFVVVKGPSPVFITKFLLDDKTKNAFHSFSFRVRPGDWDSIHDDSVSYLLPFGPEIHAKVVQGYNGSVTHFGNFAHSIDFGIPVGTPVHAARKGYVMATESRYSEGGFRKDLLSKANFIIIQHEDGTLGNYAHLMKNGVVVKVGETVEAGQLIGYSGNTGYTQGPHLHFEVHKPNRQLEVTTIPTVFTTQYSDRDTLNEFYTYWHPKPGIDPPKTDILPEDIQICKLNAKREKIQCGDNTFQLGENFLVSLEFIRPGNQRIEVDISIDGKSFEPIKLDWVAQKNLAFEGRYLSIANNPKFIGRWKVKVRINGEEKKILFFDVKQ